MTVYSQTLGLALILLLGYWGARLVSKAKMPMVVGYILVGLVLSPSLLHVIPQTLNDELEIAKILGLGVIALLIGGELEIKKLRKLGKAIMGITVAQVIGTFVAVFIATFYLLKLPLGMSLLLGAMATATAPAGTVAVIREYKAKGSFTSALLGVVAIDDAVCIIFFGLTSAIVAVLHSGTALQLHNLLEPLLELSGSLILGIITGLLSCFFLRHTTDRHHKVVLLVGIALLNSGIANLYNLSPLLVNMVSGFMIANIYPKPGEMNHLENIELPIYIVFFVLAGASLHLDVLLDNWIWAAVYIIARGIGKIGGSYVGAHFSGAPQNVKKYLGCALIPKAGVTIGLLMIVQGRFPEMAMPITAIELAAVTICELIGPMGARYALISAGEIQLNAARQN
ncbi:MAG: cation:proton antiporter [Dethiobacteria bacterium]|jgi:Kef-type K+ transport system membrane component KefB|nr:cation:proton antiporter [Bacillota bacterium]